MAKKPAIGIGVDSFIKLITEGYYYVDKTELITELVPQSPEVALFTRPRRFGKSLAMSMLAEFFDITKKEENAHLFDGLKISEYPEICREYQNAYPVVSLSFKEVYGDSAEGALSALRKLIAKLYIAAENIPSSRSEKPSSKRLLSQYRIKKKRYK